MKKADADRGADELNAVFFYSSHLAPRDERRLLSAVLAKLKRGLKGGYAFRNRAHGERVKAFAREHVRDAAAKYLREDNRVIVWLSCGEYGSREIVHFGKIVIPL